MKAPVARSISWPAAALSVLPLVPMLILNCWLAPQWFPIGGVIVWGALVLLARRVFTKAHRKGIRLVKGGHFEEAIPHFAEGYAAMCRRPWVDKFRSLILGSASQWCYREMALCNQAFCYGQIGDGQKMRELYEKALAEFPGSILAATALRMVDSLTQKKGASKPLQETPGTVPSSST